MPVPDVSDAAGLVLYDLTAADLKDRAVLAVTSAMPGATIPDGSVESTVLDAGALLVAELVYAMNRVPGATLEALLSQGYLIPRSAGVAPSSTVRFFAAAAGASVPRGTIVAVAVSDEQVQFTTDTDLTLLTGTPSGTVTVTGSDFTALANGVGFGTPVTVLTGTTGVTSASLAATVGGGADPENADAYITRASNRLGRLSDVLGRPKDFERYALEQVGVARALALDDTLTDTLPTPSGVTATPSATGGTLAAGTYTYRVSAVNAQGETLASAAVTASTTGTTSSVAVSWAAVTPPLGVSAVTGYRVYGRTGTVGLLTTTAAGTLTYTDTGAATPGVGVATTNTTAPVAGAADGYVTVAVLAAGGALVPGATKTSLQAAMGLQAQANLGVRVVDPTITTVPVTATVKALPGFVAATVQASVVAALTAYLSPASWPWAATVRRNDLIALMEGVAGVDYVTAGHPTIPAGDVALAGVAPLAAVGTLTITAVS